MDFVVLKILDISGGRDDEGTCGRCGWDGGKMS